VQQSLSVLREAERESTRRSSTHVVSILPVQLVIFLQSDVWIGDYSCVVKKVRCMAVRQQLMCDEEIAFLSDHIDEFVALRYMGVHAGLGMIEAFRAVEKIFTTT
jgi:hypothetical protein